jgi:uncharacterized protein (DUF697 family)
MDQAYETFDQEFDEFETDEFEFEEESEMPDADLESPFSEEEEMALAAELFEITDEQELDLFLGKLFKKAWRGIKKVGGKVLRPLGGVLKGIAKKALPFVGGALGSFIPIPGVGTALGTALGGALSRSFEMEFEGMSPDQQEFEMARRFVKVAGAAARQAAIAPPTVNPLAAAKSAVLSALRTQAPGMARLSGSAIPSRISSGGSGRWIRRGRKIILLGA